MKCVHQPSMPATFPSGERNTRKSAACPTCTLIPPVYFFELFFLDDVSFFLILFVQNKITRICLSTITTMSHAALRGHVLRFQIFLFFQYLINTFTHLIDNEIHSHVEYSESMIILLRTSIKRQRDKKGVAYDAIATIIRNKSI